MYRVLMIMMVIICLAIGLARAGDEGQSIQGRKFFEGRRYPIEPLPWTIYKTEEEIAYDLLMYGLKHVPNLKLRITHYEDLLEAYRRTLNVVKEPKEPVPQAPKRTN